MPLQTIFPESTRHATCCTIACWLACLLFAFPSLAADEGARGDEWRLVIGDPISAAPPSPGPDPIPCLPCQPEPTNDGFTVDTSRNTRVTDALTLQGLYLKVGGQIYDLDGSSDTRLLARYQAGEIRRLRFVDPAGVVSPGAALVLRLEIHRHSGEIHIQETAID